MKSEWQKTKKRNKIKEMANDIAPKESELKIIKRDIYEEFVLWFAMPRHEKIRLGIETQGQFAAFHKVHPDTLTDWKALPDFNARINDVYEKWAMGKHPDVFQSIYLTALKGNPMSQLLWLQYFRGFNPKKVEDKTNKVELTIQDIRFLIEALPEPLKSKHHTNLRELIDDSSAVAQGRINGCRYASQTETVTP